MTQIKPLSSMETPRFADVATFFRLPIEKNLSKNGVLSDKQAISIKLTSFNEYKLHSIDT